MDELQRFRLDGRVALVAGGSGGIGVATWPCNSLLNSSMQTTGRVLSSGSAYTSSTSSIRATNSPLTLGMHQDRFCHGFSAFF